jgi:hypothetical protein
MILGEILVTCFVSRVRHVLVVGSANSVGWWIWQIVSLLSAIISMKNHYLEEL